MDSIRVHFTIRTDSSFLMDRTIPGWAIPRQGTLVRLDDQPPRLVESVSIQYQSGLGDSLNPTLVEVQLA